MIGNPFNHPERKLPDIITIVPNSSHEKRRFFSKTKPTVARIRVITITIKGLVNVLLQRLIYHFPILVEALEIIVKSS